MLKAYKYRIEPNANQRELLARHFGCARWTYNWALAKKKAYYEENKKSLSRRAIQDELVQLKKTEEHAWLKEVNSQALLSALLHMESAYKNFFQKRAQFPKFKKKHNKQSFQCPQHVKLEDKKIDLPKIKGIKVKIHRPFVGAIKTVTISKSAAGKYFASILVEKKQEKEPPIAPPIIAEETLGIDVGLTHFAITSKGEKIASPKYLKKSLKRLGKAQKIRARKDYKNTSKNYVKQSISVAKVHEKMANQRYNFIQQYTAELVGKNQATSFAVEDLHIKGMIRNRKLSRAIADSAWGLFLRCLSYKCKWYGKNFLQVGRFLASSKTCHLCGYKVDSLPLSVRAWRCTCGALHDRDVNAARVISKEAIADALGQSVSVKRSSVAIPVSVGVTAKG